MGFLTFARSHAEQVSRIAGLVFDDPDTAADATRSALASAAARADSLGDDRARLDAVLGRLARRARAVGLRSAARRDHGGFQVRDLSHVTAEPDSAEDGLAARDAWWSLTSDERAVLALHDMAGLSTTEIARLSWRRRPAVERDLARAADFLAEVAGLDGVPRGSLVPDDAAQGPVGQLPALVAEVAEVLDAHPAGRWWTRTGGVLAAGGAALTVAALIVAATVWWPEDEREAAAPPVGGPTDEWPAMPAVLDGLKIVGYRGIMLTVPNEWEQLLVPCDQVGDTYVVYPASRRDAPCRQVASHASGLSFGAADKVNLPSVNRSAGDAPIERVVVTAIRREGNQFVQVAGLLDENVAVVVRSADRSQVKAVIASVRKLPPGFAVMPNVENVSPEVAGERLHDVGLQAVIYQDPSQVGYSPLVVANQSPSVGTVLSVDEPASLGVVLGPLTPERRAPRVRSEPR